MVIYTLNLPKDVENGITERVKTVMAATGIVRACIVAFCDLFRGLIPGTFYSLLQNSVIPTTYFQRNFQTNDWLKAHAVKIILTLYPYAAFSSQYAFLVFLDKPAILTFLSKIQADADSFT